MAKLVYLILLLLFLLLPVFGSSFYVAFDAMSLDSFIADGNRVSFDFSYRYGDFRISLPVSYSFCLDDDISALDVALRVDAYPFRDIELFFGVDVLRYLRFFGLSSPQERNVLLSSISIGYTFSFSHFFIEPRIIAQDPARIAENETAILDDHFPFYFDYYAQLLIGVRF